ncbi:MAG: SMC family ATPase [Spirosomataceae bacterium]
MIPIKLTLKGLYSYREAQIIDFTHLTEASIFGIFGKVGSGKSSILEAITFALYGETERMNKSGDDRNYNMMNLRSDELLIDYECVAGKEGHRYRFTVKGKRNSKRFEDVKTLERKSYQWMAELNDWAPIEVDNAAERIIGLSYDNFKRTIIIPQGRFQEFVELPLSKRTQMMNDIFQLERYDLAPKVKVLKERNEKIVEHLNGKLTQLSQYTPQALEQVQNELNSLKTLIRVREKELSERVEQEKQIESLRLNVEKREQTQKQLEVLQQQTESYAQRAERLQQYQVCLVNFKPLFQQQTDVLAQLQQTQRNLAEKITEETRLSNELQAQHVELGTLQVAYEQREYLKHETESLVKVLKIKELELRQADFLQKKQRGEDAQNKTQAQLQGLKAQKLEQEQALEKLRNNRIDLAKMSEVREWFTLKTTLQTEKETIRNEATKIKEEVEKQQVQKIKILEVLRSTVGVLPTQDDLTLLFTQAKAALTQQKEHLDKMLVHLHTQQALQAYANALQSGEPCPLCGSVHHPNVLHSEDLTSALQQAERQRQELHTQNEQLEQYKSQLAEIETKIQFFEIQKESIKSKWSENQQAIAKHEADFRWVEFSKDDVEKIKMAFEQAQQHENEVQALERLIQQKDKEISETQQYLDDKIRPALQKIVTEYTVVSAEIDTYKVQVSSSLWEEVAAISAKLIQERIQQQQTHYEQITKKYEELTQKIQAQKDRQNILLGEMTVLNTHIQHQTQALHKVKQTIQNQLVTTGFSDETAVREMVDWALDIDTEQRQIEAFKVTLNTYQEQLNLLREQTKGLNYDADLHQELRLLVNEWTAALNDLRKQEGGLTAQIAQMEKDLAAQADLLKQKDQLEIRGKDIDTLAKLFKASGFVSYVSAMHLQNLCNQANVRFHKMTRQQLQLEVYESRPAEYDFQVRDLLNEGRTRAVKTLSGGQKFQVALALALALADHIHTQTQSTHNFFFLDEGFGSLDKDALTEVFETLKSLRKENRIVGVISHVEELQQEIDRFIRVRNDEITGSVIEI